MTKMSCLLILATGIIFSQNKQLLYGFNEIPQSLLLNPGTNINNDWYVGMPLLSNIHAHGGSSGVSVYELFAADGIDFNTKLEKVVYNLGPKDFFTANEQMELLSGGYTFGPSYNKNQYLSFGIYQEMDAIAYFPKDYAILVYEGNQDNIDRIFNAGHLNAAAELISVFHVGYNKKINKKFTYGVRGKIYSNLINLNSTKNSGYFVTVRGESNIYDHIFNLDLEVRTSGLKSLTDKTEFEPKDLVKRAFLGGNLGLGFDVGFTYQINKQWYVDASLLDIGFIRHSKDTENYKLDGSYVFEGVNPIFPESGSSKTADEYWSEIEDEFEDLFTIDTTNAKYTTWRPLKLNASLNYAFGEKRDKECNCRRDDKGFLNRLGLQLYAIKRPLQPQMALTAYYFRSFLDGLQAKVSYTVDTYSFKNLGLGISANLGSFNFYLMADNLLEYQNIYDARTASLQLGINFIFNKNEN